MALANSQNEITYLLINQHSGEAFKLENYHGLPPKVEEFIKLYCYNGQNTRYDTLFIQEFVKVLNKNIQEERSLKHWQQLDNLMQQIQISRPLNKNEESKMLRYLKQKTLVLKQIREEVPRQA